MRVVDALDRPLGLDSLPDAMLDETSRQVVRNAQALSGSNDTFIPYPRLPGLYVEQPDRGSNIRIAPNGLNPLRAQRLARRRILNLLHKCLRIGWLGRCFDPDAPRWNRSASGFVAL
jgi:hypothetical protein